MQLPRDISAVQFYDISKLYSEEKWGCKFSEQEMKMFANQWKRHCMKNAGSGALCAKYGFLFFSFHFFILGYMISIINSNQMHSGFPRPSGAYGNDVTAMFIITLK